MIEPFVERFGTFQANGEQRRQSGVLRINCIDCLDRTNVVQGWLARKQLDRLLAQLSLLPQGSSIKEAFPEVRLHASHWYCGQGPSNPDFFSPLRRRGQGMMGERQDCPASSLKVDEAA